MDIKDIESTLEALRKLYSLLRKDGDTSLDFTSNALDDKSRFLLKHLLDMATKKVFKAHREYSTQPVQLSDGCKQLLPALLNQSKISPLIQNSGNDLDNFDKYTKTTSQETSSTQPMLGVTASLYRSSNQCCKICKRPIAKQSKLCDQNVGTKILSLHQLKNQTDNFPESSRRLEKDKQKGLHGPDQISIGSIEFSLNRPATSAVESTEEYRVVDSLSEEASDVIKQIELCIQNLKIAFESSGLYKSTSGPVDSSIQNELSDRESDFVLHTESGNPGVATGTDWGQIGYSDADGGDLLHQTMNEQHTDSSVQRQLPSKTMTQQMEMRLPNQNSCQHFKPLQTKSSIMSLERHISSQREDPLHGDKELNQITDCVSGQNVKSLVAKIESLNQAKQNDGMPSETYNFNCLSPKNYMMMEKVPVLNRAMQNDLMPSEIYNHKYLSPNKYMNSEKVPAQSTRNFPSQVLEGPTQLDNRIPQSAGNSKWMDEEQVGHPKKKDSIYPARMILHHKHDYDDTCLDSSSSNWRSQQPSTSNCESEEDYVPGWKQRQKYDSPTASSGSEVYPLRRRYHHNTSGSLDEYSFTSSGRDDGEYELTSSNSTRSNESGEYSLPSSATDRVSSIGYSESKRYPLHGQPRYQYHKQPRHLEMNLKAEKTGSIRFHKQSREINPKKRVGTWKKLKNKLAIIFHHHHHHHHHHHDPADDGGDASDHGSRISQGKNLSKRTGKSPTPVRLEANGEQEVVKRRKPLINAVSNKDQHRHFDGLVGRLFRHIQHSRKSEMSGKNIKHLRKGQHESKKACNKQHWWQMLQHQRPVKKLGLGYKRKSTKRFSKIK